MRTVLFLCTSNSCRSQMAEAIVNARHPGWRAFSAGVQPAGYVHPLAIRVLNEIGIEHEGQSKSADLFHDQDFDLVTKAMMPRSSAQYGWVEAGVCTAPFRTGRAAGTEEQRLKVFRRVRDKILAALPALLA